MTAQHGRKIWWDETRGQWAWNSWFSDQHGSGAEDYRLDAVLRADEWLTWAALPPVEDQLAAVDRMRQEWYR